MVRFSRKRWGGDIIGTLLMIVAVPIFILGISSLLAPEFTFKILGEVLPPSILEELWLDLYIGSYRAWPYLVVGAVLWFIGRWLRG